MEQNFQTSFIPKKPVIKERGSASRPIGALLVVSLFILFAVLLISGGLYFYKGLIVRQVKDMDSNLQLARNRFEPAKIAELQTLDKRLRAAGEILSRHTVVTPVLEALEDITLKTVRYTTFDYTLGVNNSNDILVSISGQAVGYRSVALQADLFTKNKNIIDPVFSNLRLDTSGNVLFDLEFTVDPSFVNYKQVLATQS